MATKMSNGRHVWNADEPVNAGGEDTGPSPYELLLGSLAACTCITISWYCKHKGLSLESVSTTYDFSRIHMDDCKDCDIPDRGFIEKITRNVHIRAFSMRRRKSALRKSRHVARFIRIWQMASSLRTTQRFLQTTSNECPGYNRDCRSSDLLIQ